MEGLMRQSRLGAAGFSSFAIWGIVVPVTGDESLREAMSVKR